MLMTQAFRKLLTKFFKGSVGIRVKTGHFIKKAYANMGFFAQPPEKVKFG